MSTPFTSSPTSFRFIRYNKHNRYMPLSEVSPVFMTQGEDCDLNVGPHHCPLVSRLIRT
jgi:hypothetical protein